MTVYSALDPVSAAIYSTLNVSALTTLAPGGVGDDIAQLTSRPSLLYEVQERNLGGLGQKPGTGRTMEIDIRLHVFSEAQGFIEAQQIMAVAIGLLRDAPAVTGYGSWAIFHDDTIPLADEEIAGVKVKELVSIWRLYVTEIP